MKLIKMMGVAAMLALAAMAIAGASASAATLKAEACINATGACKELLKGDKFTLHGTKIEFEGLGISFTQVCLSTLSGEIVTALATKEEKIDMHITSAVFTSNGALEPCSQAILGLNLPWLILTAPTIGSTTSFPSVGIDKFLITRHGIGECQLTQSGADQVKLTWLDGAPSVVDLAGSITLENANPFCASLEHLRGSYKVTSVTAADLPGANNIRILKE